MSFSSHIFIFIFLPVCLAGYYFLQQGRVFRFLAPAGRCQWAKYWLVAVSLWFYGFLNPWYLLLIAGSVLFNLLILKNINRWGKKALIAGVAGNLALLFYCKYVNFFLENINHFFSLSFPMQKLLLPLGISFFTFQQISFLVDTYRGEVGEVSTADYILLVLYFPKLVQGPLALHSELLPQFKKIGNIRWDWEKFYRGLVLLVLGMAKKVLLADTLGRAVDYGYTNLATLHTADALIVMLAFTLQLYFDFSGYCDMAMGISRMLGIELPVNFVSPYQAENIIGFWRGWHMTLNRFLTKYIYIPLGGNRQGTGKMYRNLLIVFFVSGLWHGAGFTFLIWGMMHGILYVLTRMLQKKHRENKITRPIKMMLTFLYVNITWVFFRAPSVSDAFLLLQKICLLQWQKVEYHLAANFNVEELWYVIKILRLDRWPSAHYILTAALLTAGLGIVFSARTAGATADKITPGIVNTLMLSVLFVWCVLSFSKVSTFLYVNF